ncbi:unnamed protein product [Mycena citricolor]|uniref:Uncharacterized protein n=1 Tax=Mycena citricolor TaxID=2018698 RepID=A0AAD2HR71_9AGAR|nr:unnamed protein product [Mycena citricolor]
MLRHETHDAAHEAQIRSLLAQRTAAIDYDSPSVYSAPFFSPRPNEVAETRSLHLYRSPMTVHLTPERNRLNELAESMLDMDDESSSSHSDEEENPIEESEAEHEEPDPRMSLLGPKMRFHSKAPWEMDGGDIMEEEEDEVELSRGRDGFKKGLGFRSASRGTTASGRPSGESTRSHHAKAKRSFESSHSHHGRSGALLALGQASLSSTSLITASASNAPRPTGLRLNFPLPTSESSSTSPHATPSRAPGSPRSLMSQQSRTVSPIHQEVGHSVASYSSRRPSHGTSHYPEDMHPFANPDLVVSYAEDPYTPAPTRSAFTVPSASIGRSDSSATVTDSASVGSSVSRSIAPTLTPDTSTSTMSPTQSPRSRSSTFHGREISGPLPIHSGTSNINHVSSPQMTPILPPGWTEHSGSPAFDLISLEQARAQRSRSATTNNNMSVSSTSSTPFPDVLASAESTDLSPTGRTRARSISTGARAKSALQTMVGGAQNQEPSPGKTIKHKKSGFMRLFNGREKDEKASPPPVPSLSDGYAAFSGQHSQPSAQAHSAGRKGSIPRVPAPPVSPSMFGPEFPGNASSRPPLSINTGQATRLRAASAAEDFQTRTLPPHSSDNWDQLDLPQSAPPNVTEFPALKLRPVSTLFSAKFGDHIISPDNEDLESLSPSTAMSPVTPGLVLARSPSNIDKMAPITEDQSALVQALQDQIVSAKKAWQRHIWELEGQVRDLKAQVEAAHEGDYCMTCGRGRPPMTFQSEPGKASVVNRPRAHTGTGTATRFGSVV